MALKMTFMRCTVNRILTIKDANSDSDVTINPGVYEFEIIFDINASMMMPKKPLVKIVISDCASIFLKNSTMKELMNSGEITIKK